MAKLNLFEAFENYEELVDAQSLIEDYAQEDTVNISQEFYSTYNSITLLSQEIEQSLFVTGALIDINKSIDISAPLESSQAKVINTAIEGILLNTQYTKTIPALEQYGYKNSKSQATKDLKISLEGIIKDIWEKIKQAFKSIGNFLKSLYNKIASFIKSLISSSNDTVKKASDLEDAVNKNKAVATESVALEDSGMYNLDKPLLIVAYSFGEYLGDDKQELDRYVKTIHNLDQSILTLLNECSLGLNSKPLDMSRISNEFKKPTDQEQISFITESVGVKPEYVQVIELPFKKGFIWHVTNEKDGVRAGIRKQATSFRVFKLPALTIREIKTYMQSLQRDLAQNNNEANKLATQITNIINNRLTEIERLSSSTHTSDDEITEHRQKLKAAQISLNSIKNIEFGFWNFKVQTLTKIKQYCDMSVTARSKDYSDHRKTIGA